MPKPPKHEVGFDTPAALHLGKEAAPVLALQTSLASSCIIIYLTLHRGLYSSMFTWPATEPR
ncbi:hypothetical protein LX36DRAFT_651689 [Colletotrichum falcatum]|nr:hypothetical protein LX36DRAFT_651689 [Colletotrichum falcatum]